MEHAFPRFVYSAALIQTLAVFISVVAAAGTAILLILTAVWGRELLVAYRDLNTRVEELEEAVFQEDAV